MTKTILVVDDHDDDRVLLQQLFESQGYQTLLANNGEVAQEILTTESVDLVFSDVLMPIVDGLQLCKTIKASNELKHIPVILYTSIYSHEEDVKLAIKVGADLYLVKPISPDDILKVLKQIFAETTSRIKPDNNAAPHPVVESKEQYLRLYSTQLVQRLEEEVTKLGEEITKRKKIEQEQKEILNSIIDGVITIDEKGNILTFNKASEGLFGYKAEEVIGKNIKLLMPEPYASQHNHYIQHYIDTGEAHVIGTGTGREVEGLRKNKETFPLRLLVAELPEDADGQQRFIGSCQELTYVKQQEEQLRRSQKMDALGKLTGGIAHDYNNMLGIILGYTELLKNALNEQPKLAKYIYEIQRAGERGANLTNKLLNFSRKTVSNAEILNINTLLQEERHMLKKTLTARIQLTFNLAEELWPVYLDSSELEDAIINISINAMHAIKRQGTFNIQTSNTTLNQKEAQVLQLPAGDYVFISLTDSGCGMDEMTKEKIFEPFFSTKKEKGTGLGLLQVYGFVQRSNGVIKVYSEPEHGTQFSLYFPRYTGAIENIQPEIESSAGLSGNESILVVDDEPALLNFISEVLGQQGYHVICVDNGIQALHLLKTKSIDLLLSDVIMPEMDGYQLAASVQENYPHIKIQLASGFSDNRHEYMIDDSLNNNLLQKPYSTYTLLKRIRELLD